MKYIMLCRKLADNTLLFEPVIFSTNMVHVEISKAITRIRGNEGFVPVSAGEVYWDSSGEVVCYGESETLRLKSHPERDAKIIRHHDYGGGIFT
jgi:hypothetical protein